MTKLRVYEYAKEQNMSSKEIISILKRLDIPVNNHMSVIDADAQGKITQFFADVKRKAQEDKMKKAAEKDRRPEQMKQETRPAKSELRTTNVEHTRADRKVDHTRTGGQNRFGGSRPDGDQRGYRSDGPRGPRPEGDQRGYRSDGPRGPRPEGDQRGYRSDGPRGPRPEGDQRGYRSDGPRGPRPEGDQRGYRSDGPRGPRPEGDQRGYRSDGPRGPRPEGDQRGYRSDGPRGPRPEGDQRGYRSDGPRGPRPDGDQRGYRSDGPRGPRPVGDQRGYRSDGPRGPRPEGDQRGYRSDGPRGPRPEGGFRGPRPDRDARPGSDRRGGLVVPPPAVTEEKQDVSRRRVQPKKAKDKGAFDDKKVKRNTKGTPLKPIDYENDRGEIVAGKKRNRLKKNKDVVYGENKETPTKISIEDTINVGEFAKMIGKDTGEVIKKLLLLGIMATINQEIDFDVVTLVASDYGIEVEKKEVINEDEFETIVEHDEPDELVERPPVVTIMGHVDHGKTTLLDSIRNTRVTTQEAGGITQHIGAYQIEINNKKISFLDTPGHEAFTAMRARGAKVTDITILVVAADDGVMPQTVEAISHAKAAEVPIIVAVNKMDKPTANPDRVMQELSNHGLLAEAWGGDTIFVPVSALKGEGIDTLLEMVLLVAEVQELKANPNKRARGTVVEAELDKGKGPVATVLVQHGTLKVGDAVVVGTAFGRVRSMINDIGERITEAAPSTPVEITGLDSVPSAGDQFMVFESDSKAKAIADRRSMKKHELGLRKNTISLDDLFNQIKEGDIKDLNLILKADVQGTVEALRTSLEKIQIEGVRVRIIHTGVGTISESDVTLAATSNAIVIGFNVRPDVNARQTADQEKVDIRVHSVIYKVIEEIEGALKGMLDPEYEEKVIGQVEVRQLFKASKIGTIAGCYVTDGKITRDSEVRVIRDGVVVHSGKLDTLKRFKDDVKEVTHGYECGITIKNYNEIAEGDILEAFIMVEIAR